VDYSGREYNWLIKRLEAVEAALVDNPFNRNFIAEKAVLTKEIRLRTYLLVAVCDGEETQVGRWRSVEDCAKAAQLKGIDLGMDYPVEGMDKVVKFIARPISEGTDKVVALGLRLNCPL
jgi:hypothetical protein